MWFFVLLSSLLYGRGCAAQLTSSGVTLFGVVPSETSSSATFQESISATPVGTASDGTATTYSEVVVYYGSNSSSSGARGSVIPTKTQSGILVESASGYDLVLSDSNSGFRAHCSSNGCIQSEYAILETTISSTRTSTFTSSASSSFTNGVTVAIVTLTPQFTQAVLSSSASSTIAVNPTLQHASSIHSENVIGPAVGGAVGGAAFIILLTLSLWLIHRCRRRRQGLREIRELPISTREFRSNSSKMKTTSISKSYVTPQYNGLGVYQDLMNKPSTPQTTLSSKVAEESIRAPSPSVLFPKCTPSSTPPPPPPPPVDPVAPPKPAPLPTRERNRPSRFVERLSLNSTDLNVLMALARAESSRSTQKRRQEASQRDSAPTTTTTTPPTTRGGNPNDSFDPYLYPYPHPYPSLPLSPTPPPAPLPFALPPSNSPTASSFHSVAVSSRERPNSISGTITLAREREREIESPATFHSFPTTSNGSVSRFESPPPPRTPSSVQFDWRTST